MRCNSVNIDPHETDRSCGFLTKTERQYLIGEGWQPGSQSAISDKRNNIKVRIRHALADMALLQEQADERLKTDVIKMDMDPSIYSQTTIDHLAEGMMRFASDATTGEEFTDIFFEAINEGEIDDMYVDAADYFDAAFSGNPEKAFKSMIRMMGNNFGLSKREAKRIFMVSWPE